MAYGNEQNIERLKEQGERISYDLLGFRHGQQDNDCSHSVPEKYRQDYIGGFGVGRASIKGAQVKSNIVLKSFDEQFNEMFGAH